jgi:hypothetical protein
MTCPLEFPVPWNFLGLLLEFFGETPSFEDLMAAAAESERVFNASA